MPVKDAIPASARKGAVPLLAAALVAVAATGCGNSGGTAAGTSGTAKAAAAFIRTVTTEFSRGQSGRLWETLVPADQAVVSRARYMACQSNEGFELQKFKVLETYADTIDIGGKPTSSTAVSVQVTSDDGLTTATMHAVSVGGTWRWTLPASDLAAYKLGKCPSS
jgi:hypothetical protein